MAVIASNDADFSVRLSSANKVVVKFYSDWCGSCKLFSPKYKRIASDPTHDDVVFLDINAEQNENARKLAGVDNLPFFATFKDGKLMEATATSKEDRLISMIASLKNEN